MLNRGFNGNRFGAVITVLLELYLNAYIKAVCGTFLYGVVLNAYLDIGIKQELPGGRCPCHNKLRCGPLRFGTLQQG